jgi:AraC-like DNA-binding protein
MKPQLLKVSSGPSHSFSVRRDVAPHFNNKWHYHEEVELIYFIKGEGTQFIGDNIKRFRSGDVVLVGKKLPHYWRFDNEYFDKKTSKNVDVRVAHFCENFWGDTFLKLKENSSIKAVLENARRGIEVRGNARKTVPDMLEKMHDAEGPDRIIILLEILLQIAGSEQSILSSQPFNSKIDNAYNERINAIYEYSLANFRNKIHLDEIASVANISPNSFCRYFKSQMRKTYSQFLIELKVEYACKLLMENKVIIKQLCYECGFNNFASFHKYFKMITGKTPLKYQKDFI